MLITFDSFVSDENSTLSKVYVEDSRFCYGLEDAYREVKVPGKTRIPEGKYKVLLRTEGGMHERYVKRFKDSHRGMLWLQDVPNFQWVYIHPGNTHLHTEGCPLVGARYSDTPGDFRVMESTKAYLALYEQVWEEARDGELFVEMIRGD